jgi:hypothetical protein
MTTINIDFKSDVIVHTLELDNKIGFIKQIREATNCSLRDAKDAAEKISKIITDLKPATNVVRSQIARVLSDHDENNPENLQFLLDVLQFMQTTKPATCGHTTFLSVLSATMVTTVLTMLLRKNLRTTCVVTSAVTSVNAPAVTA